jgi:ribonuclease HII
MIIAGIDEAGRGPCIGPLVMAIACIQKKNEEKLNEIGVKDSKLLASKERQRQFGLIKKTVSEFGITKLSSQEIDELRDRKSLNELEAMRAAALLNNLKTKPDIVYVDSPDTIMAAFGERIRKYLSFDTIIKSEHKADLNYPIVSAASIIAKVERDNEIKSYAKEFGELGTGYSSDERTIVFLKKYVEEFNELPQIARKSWCTSQKILDEKFQKKLF